MIGKSIPGPTLIADRSFCLIETKKKRKRTVFAALQQQAELSHYYHSKRKSKSRKTKPKPGSDWRGSAWTTGFGVGGWRKRPEMVPPVKSHQPKWGLPCSSSSSIPVANWRCYTRELSLHANVTCCVCVWSSEGFTSLVCMLLKRTLDSWRVIQIFSND